MVLSMPSREQNELTKTFLFLCTWTEPKGFPIWCCVARILRSRLNLHLAACSFRTQGRFLPSLVDKYSYCPLKFGQRAFKAKDIRMSVLSFACYAFRTSNKHITVYTMEKHNKITWVRSVLGAKRLDTVCLSVPWLT